MTKSRASTSELSFPALVHLAMGDCLIASGCELCDERGDGPLAPRVLRMQAAREIWNEQHDQLIATWVQWLEGRGQPGLCGIPLFAAVVLDNVPLPPCDPSWPHAVQSRFFAIEGNLSGLTSALRALSPALGAE